MKRSVLAAAAALTLTAAVAQAQEFYIGEVITTGASFCPRGTLHAQGQILPIESNAALYSLLGTKFGGDGRKTFGLPDIDDQTGLRACVVLQGYYPPRS